MSDSICSVFESGGSTGTSTDDGVVVTIDSRNFRNGYILIKNTGSTNTVQYKIDSYVKSSGSLSIAEVSYTDIAPAATASFKIDDAPRAKHVVTIKSKVSSSHSAYAYEYCLGL